MVSKALVYRWFLHIWHRANGGILRGCLLGIVIACAYNFLFINHDIGALSEQSWSEEKATYGIKLFGTRVIGAAIAGATIGAVADIFRTKGRND